MDMNLPFVCVCVCARVRACVCVRARACVRICNLKLLDSHFSVCFCDRDVNIKEILQAGSVEHSDAEQVELDRPNRLLSSISEDSVEDIEKQGLRGECS
jgi:hypothetical protein